MENFSIVEEVNINRLNENIAGFMFKYKYKPYIFANKETLETLKSCQLSEYYECKVFEDNTRNFGEIELR